MKRYDAIIIGFGKGGKTLAGFLASQGKQVAMIEKSNQMYGGTCINEGCIPSKSLIVQAKDTAYDKAVAQKEVLVEKLRKKNFDKLDQLEKVDVITAEASFESDHEVRIVADGVNEVLYGEQIFLNTGSVPILPKVEGIEHTAHVYTSAEMMKKKELPASLAIIGGGYIGLEFSSMYARYGSDVTVFEYGDRLVKREDADVAAAIQEVLEQQGVSFRFETKVQKFANIGEQVEITYADKDGNVQRKVVDAVLLATGRKANTETLQLDKAGVWMRGAMSSSTNICRQVLRISLP